MKRRKTIFFFFPCKQSLLRTANVGIACFFFLVIPDGFSQEKLIKKTEYYDANKLVIKEIYFEEEGKRGIKTGLFTGLYSSGKVKISGNYKKNKAEGIWERYYENGNLKSLFNYKNGVLTGKASIFLENGKLSQSGIFKNDKEDSLWKFYFENGKIKSKGYYQNGIQEGLWQYYHEDSTLKATSVIHQGKGIYREFFAKGTLRMEGLIVNGLSDSIWKYYHENGNLKATGSEKSGEREGFWRFFYQDGTISSEGHFKKNQKIGHWKYFHENGKLSSEGTLENDDKEGVWKFYLPSGTLMGEGNFTKGNGDYQEFYDNGKVKLKGKISKNLYEGPWTYFFEDGGLEGECNYVAGYGQYFGYYENGSIKMKGQMRNGQKVGSWDLLGKDGKLIGHYKTFYDLVQPTAQFKQRRDSTIAKPRNTGRPDYMSSKKRSRHFISKVNEIKGFIVSANPFAAALSSFPIGIEYFFHDRLGFELMFTLYRQPFFANHGEEIENKRIYTIGNSIDFRQKLYSPDHGSGNLYIGQELRFSNYSHKLLVIETIDTVTVGQNFEGKETKIELTLLVGNRFFQYYNKHNSITLDLYTGIGFGYRFSQIPEQLLIYNRLKTNTLTIPFRLGFNFGYFF